MRPTHGCRPPQEEALPTGDPGIEELAKYLQETEEGNARVDEGNDDIEHILASYPDEHEVRSLEFGSVEQ